MRHKSLIPLLLASTLFMPISSEALPSKTLKPSSGAKTIVISNQINMQSSPAKHDRSDELRQSSPAARTNPPPSVSSDFFVTGDDFARTDRLLRTVDDHAGDGHGRFAALVQNIVQADRANGPRQASVGLGITSQKHDFARSKSRQEVDGLYIETRTGLHGDTSAILADAQGIDGGDSFVNVLEATATTISPMTLMPIRGLRFQAALIDQHHAVSAGTNMVAEAGLINYGILLQSHSSKNAFENFVYANTADVRKWSVDGQGNEYLAGTAVAGAVSTSSLTLTETTAAAIAWPADGAQTLFLDQADHKLKRKDSHGIITIIG